MTAAEENAIRGKAVMLYDGVCALCNGMVRFCSKRDPAGKLLYVPLQSQLGAELRARHTTGTATESAVMLVDVLTAREQFFRQSEAPIAALRLLQAPWPLIAQGLSIAPRFLRDWVYRAIARNRYRLFGRYAVCPMPAASIRERFLGLGG